MPAQIGRFGLARPRRIQTAGVGRVEHIRIRSQFRSWTEELACDLNAVRTFGPAGLSSITEFLSTLRLPTNDTRRWTPQQASTTHPSLKTRVRVMARCLERIGSATTLTTWLVPS